MDYIYIFLCKKLGGSSGSPLMPFAVIQVVFYIVYKPVAGYFRVGNVLKPYMRHRIGAEVEFYFILPFAIEYYQPVCVLHIRHIVPTDRSFRTPVRRDVVCHQQNRSHLFRYISRKVRAMCVLVKLSRYAMQFCTKTGFSSMIFFKSYSFQ